jgi:hypothetical protein
MEKRDPFILEFTLYWPCKLHTHKTVTLGNQKYFLPRKESLEIYSTFRETTCKIKCFEDSVVHE